MNAAICGGRPRDVFNNIVDNGAGNLPGAHFNSGDHTNQLIPVYAIGAGADLLDGYADQLDPVRGLYVDNTEIFRVMMGTPVPVPPSVLLLGSGLLGLAFLQRKQQSA